MLCGLQNLHPARHIYVKEKDYFNAKATFQSVVANASCELKEEAQGNRSGNRRRKESK
jgi:hypothetical protein